MTILTDRRAFMAGLGALGAAGGFGAAASAQLMGAPQVPGLPSASPGSVGMATDLNQRIATMFQRRIAANEITGCITAVARKNKLVHYATHGLVDLETETPMPYDGMFVMMSSTKPVTGVALIQQMEEGKVHLDDPITKFIPELTGMMVRKEGAPSPGRGETDPPENLEPAHRIITIKDLATHTSGLNAGPVGVPDGTPNTLAAQMPYLKNRVLDFQPGTRWAYSAATGPDVLARVVEITSGMPYDQYLKARIFDPVGMVDTAHNLTSEQAERVITRYQRRNDRWAPAAAFPGRQSTYFAGSYGLTSTAQDYLLFESMLLNQGTSLSGNQVLSPLGVELMRTNLVGDLYEGIGNRTEGTGFGIQVRTVLDPETCGCGRAVGGFGWGGAYGTMSWTDPKNELVGVYMVQQPVDAIRTEFEQTVQDAIVS